MRADHDGAHQAGRRSDPSRTARLQSDRRRIRSARFMSALLRFASCNLAWASFALVSRAACRTASRQIGAGEIGAAEITTFQPDAAQVTAGAVFACAGQERLPFAANSPRRRAVVRHRPDSRTHQANASQHRGSTGKRRLSTENFRNCMTDLADLIAPRVSTAVMIRQRLEQQPVVGLVRRSCFV